MHVIRKVLMGIAACALALVSGLSSAQFTSGQILTAAQLNNALAAKTSNATAAITGGTITGLSAPIPIASGGTGATSSTGAGSVVLSNSPTLTTPALGTPSAVTLTNGAGLPISTGVSGLGTGVATALANAVTGSGSPVLATSPTIASPAISGGTINNASVGATTPSTGAFTTLSATTPVAIGSGGTGASTATGATGSLQYLQGATGSTARTLTNKFQDSLNIKDFSATPGTTDFQSAINATSSGGTITLPYGAYTPTLSSLSFGTKSIRFDATSGASLGTTNPITSGPSTMLDQTMQSLGNGYAYKSSLIYDTLNATAGGTGYSIGNNTVQWFGGPNVQGGRAAVQGIVALTAATSASNPNRNYQGGAFQGIANANDNGTTGSPAGQVFGGGSQGILNSGATNYLNVSAWEFNTAVTTGASVTYKSGIQISANPNDAVPGSVYDGAISISNQTGAVGWLNGLLFSNANGQVPISSSGNLIATQGAQTVNNGINFSSATFNGAAIVTPGFSVSPSGSISSNTANNFISLGASTSVNTPVMVFYTGAGGPSYDGRFKFSGGTGANGTAALEADFGFFNIAGVTTVGDSTNSTAQLTVTNTGANGSNIKLVGNGSTTPNKYIRSQGGALQIVNSAYGSVIASLSDAGNFASAGGIDNTIIGANTPAGGNFTSLTASGAVSGAGFSSYLAAPPAVGGTTPNTGNFTTLNSTGGALNGSIGATTPAGGNFTTLSASGNDALTYTNTSGQSVPSGANTTVTTWTKSFDRVNANMNASTGIFTAPAACSVTCYYKVDAQVLFSNSATAVGNDYSVSVLANGSTVAIGDSRAESTSSIFRSPQVHVTVALTAGQTIGIQAFQNTGSALALSTAGGYSYLSIQRIP